LGLIELSHHPTYHANDKLERATITNIDVEITEMTFDAERITG
jgi:hypothetical protein